MNTVGVAGHLRFHAHVWSATSPWFSAVIVTELIGSVASVMFAVDRFDRRTRRGARQVPIATAFDHPGEDHR